MLGAVREYAASHWRAFAAILTLVIGISVVYALQNPASFQEQIEACTQIKETASSESCLSRALRTTLDSEDGKIVMQRLSRLENRLCHESGHTLGRELMKRYSSIETSLSHCSQHCGGACLHGIVMQSLSEVPDAPPSPDELSYPSQVLLSGYGKQLCTTKIHACHGVGHILLQLQENLAEALAACDELASDYEFVFACKRGVYMQHAFEPRTAARAGDGSEIDTEQLLFPCKSVDDTHKVPCFLFLYLEQDRVFDAMNIDDEAKRQELRLAACSRLADRFQYLACIEGVAYAPGKPLECERFSEEDEREICVFGNSTAKTTYDRYDDAKQYCAGQGSDSLKRACYNAYFRELLFRNVQPLSNACAYSFDTACALNLAEFLKDPSTNVFRELTE